MRRSIRTAALCLSLFACAVLVGGFARTPAQKRATSGPPPLTEQLVQRGRTVVMTHACGDCHGGGSNPAAEGWLSGVRGPDMEFKIGPCYVTPGATPCFTTRPRNLTPDNSTGMGRFTERQIFNALRYGLRPEDTPDVTITSNTPGQGNFPLHPHMLAPPMPWPSWRHMHDNELRAIAAYLKRGLKPVTNKVTESEGPPDFWASEYQEMPQLKMGPLQPAPFPTVNERGPGGK